MTSGICMENTRMFCLGGVEIVFDVSNLGGELVCIFVVLLFFFFPHTHLCVLFSISGNIQVDSIKLLPTLATDG